MIGIDEGPVVKPVMRQLKKEELILLTRGEYSDYGTVGLFRVLKAFYPDTIAKQFMEEHCEPWEEELYMETEKFTAYLVKEGFVKDVRHVDWHLGSYGRYEPSMEDRP